MLSYIISQSLTASVIEGLIDKHSSIHIFTSMILLTGILMLPIITGAHVRQPEHRGVRVGAASGGPSQEN